MHTTKQLHTKRITYSTHPRLRKRLIGNAGWILGVSLADLKKWLARFCPISLHDFRKWGCTLTRETPHAAHTTTHHTPRTPHTHTISGHASHAAKTTVHNGCCETAPSRLQSLRFSLPLPLPLAARTAGRSRGIVLHQDPPFRGAVRASTELTCNITGERTVGHLGHVLDHATPVSAYIIPISGSAPAVRNASMVAVCACSVLVVFGLSTGQSKSVHSSVQSSPRGHVMQKGREVQGTHSRVLLRTVGGAGKTRFDFRRAAPSEPAAPRHGRRPRTRPTRRRKAEGNLLADRPFP